MIKVSARTGRIASTLFLHAGNSSRDSVYRPSGRFSFHDDFLHCKLFMPFQAGKASYDTLRALSSVLCSCAVSCLGDTAGSWT